jgi:hypothetical protein
MLKSNSMKLLFFTSFIILSVCSVAQTGPIVEYKYGNHKFTIRAGNAYVNNLMENATTGADTVSQYCEVLFTVDSSGKIGERIMIALLGDTAQPPLPLINFLRGSSGQWINHIGRTVWVEETFSYRYVDPDKQNPILLASTMDIYENGVHPRDVIRLEPNPWTGHPPIIDRLNTDAIK